jgi:protocatechuate 3,4-dioxygenase beta subunit
MLSRHHGSLLLAFACATIVVAAIWVLWPRDPGLDSRQSGPPHSASATAADSGAAVNSAGAHTVDRTAVADTSIPVLGDATPSPTRLVGRVEHPDAEPVAAAEVALLRRDADAFWNLDLAYAKQIDTVATARTDRDGRFAFDVVRGVPYRVRAVAPGCAPALKTQCVGGQFVVLVAAPGATLVGTVRDQADSAPIGGATLQVTVAGAELTAVEAARDGTFRVADLPAGQLTVRVSAPAYAESWKQVETRAGEATTLAVALAHGDTVRGTVRDAVSKAPIGGARVAANWTMRDAVATDSEGRYELHGVTTNEFTEVHVHATGYAAAVRHAAEGVDQPLDFDLHRGGGVRGRVLDAAGKPLPSAYVAVGASFPTQQGVYHTDWLRARVAADGTFAVDGLMPEHNYSLYARADGCGARAYELPRALPPDEWFDAGDLQLQPGAVIEGAVVDSADKPIVKIEVRLHGQNADHLRLAGDGGNTAREEVSQFTLRDLETDSEGRFRFAGIAAGTYELSANTRNLSKRVQAEPVTVADGQVVEGLRLVFDSGQSLAGHLRPPPGLAADAHWSLLAQSQGQPSWAEVKADGSFVFEQLERGTCTVHLFEGPEGWIMPPLRDVAVGRTDVELIPVAAAFITGRVVDADGKPMRASVYSRSDAGPPYYRPMPTDAAGHFKLAVLPGARVEVHAFVNGQPLSDTAVKDVLAGSDIEVKLAGPGK